MAKNKFTALTARHFHGLQSAGLQALQNLDLQVIVDCTEAELMQIVPGLINPFAALQRLYIDESASDLKACCATLSEAKPEGQRLLRRMLETASYLQCLPRLELVSGFSRLFLGFRVGFNGWIRPYFSEPCSHVCRRPICLAARQAWERRSHVGYTANWFLSMEGN